MQGTMTILTCVNYSNELVLSLHDYMGILPDFWLVANNYRVGYCALFNTIMACVLGTCLQGTLPPTDSVCFPYCQKLSKWQNRVQCKSFVCFADLFGVSVLYRTIGLFQHCWLPFSPFASSRFKCESPEALSSPFFGQCNIKENGHFFPPSQ